MSNEKQELTRALEERRKELARLLTSKDDNDPVNMDASKDEVRIKDEIADLTRKLKIIEKQRKKGN